MKAPEKIYIQPDAQDGWFMVNSLNNTLVEYTRTDAFIEKACNAFCKVCQMPKCNGNECKWISNFKKHLVTI